tara:strand:- start:11116 stop:12165 length:1050 start_codon:yes stop_codon:yes gene_type:complete
MVTDTHFGHEQNNQNTLESSIKFFETVLVPFLRKNKITRLFVLGDVFDSRTTINTNVHNVVYDLFDITLKDFDVYVIIGNHDIYYNSTLDVNSLKFLNKFDNVTLIDRPKVIDVNDKKILMMPWLTDETKIVDILDEHRDCGAEVMMGHFDITGFSFNKYTTSKNGIPSDIFLNRFKTIFSGHFHTRTKRKIGDTEFIYVGTPYQLTQADCDEERGFLIYNVRTQEKKFFSNDVSTKFINIEYPEKFTKKLINYNRVNVVIKYDNDSYTPDEYNKYIEKIENYAPVELHPIYVNTSELDVDFDMKKCDMASIPKLMETYVNSMENDDEHHLEAVYNTLFDAYKKVKGNE